MYFSLLLFTWCIYSTGLEEGFLPSISLVSGFKILKFRTVEKELLWFFCGVEYHRNEIWTNMEKRKNHLARWQRWRRQDHESLFNITLSIHSLAINRVYVGRRFGGCWKAKDTCCERHTVHSHSCRFESLCWQFKYGAIFDTTATWFTPTFWQVRIFCVDKYWLLHH